MHVVPLRWCRGMLFYGQIRVSFFFAYHCVMYRLIFSPDTEQTLVQDEVYYLVQEMSRVFGVIFPKTNKIRGIGTKVASKEITMEEGRLFPEGGRPRRLAQAFGLVNEDEIVHEDRPVQNYSPRYIYLVLEAYRREKISLGKLAELLSIEIAEARELVWDLEMDSKEELLSED